MNGTWWLVRPRSASTGITLAAGSGAVVAAAFLAAALTAPSALVERLVAMAVCVAAVGAFGGDLVAALATAVIAWTVLNGFLVDRLGTLAWHGTADAVRLDLLLGAAAAGWLAALSHRVVRHRRDVVRLRVWLYGDGLAASMRQFKEANPSG